MLKDYPVKDTLILKNKRRIFDKKEKIIRSYFGAGLTLYFFIDKDGLVISNNKLPNSGEAGDITVKLVHGYLIDADCTYAGYYVFRYWDLANETEPNLTYSFTSLSHEIDIIHLSFQRDKTSGIYSNITSALLGFSRYEHDTETSLLHALERYYTVILKQS